MKNGYLRKGFALLLSAAVLLPALHIDAGAENSDPNVIHISTTAEFEEFAKNCTLDEYSKGKTFILDRDIIFSGDEFVSVPTFGGIFKGEGHKISGISINESLSNTGVFRFIEENGKISNIIISARIEPSGAAENIGGIAGVNRGVIEKCSFDGLVEGKENIGGIAGTNEGSIIGCKVSGVISGSHITGGAVGFNSGTIAGTENTAAINTEANDTSIGIDTLSEFSITDITAPEKLTSATDSGGIAGVSEGNVIGCVNRGNVGYAHSGYNTGGIIGRQQGYVSSCINYGAINGRKDIGGIVGQSEPFTSLFISKRSADDLRDELAQLNTEIDRTLNDVRTNKDSFGEQADTVIADLNDLKDLSHNYMNEVDTIVNDNVDTINEFSVRISDLVTKIEPVSEKLTEAAESYSNAFSELKRAAEIIGDEMGESDEALKGLRPVLDDFSRITDSLDDTSKKLSNAIAALKTSMGNADDLKASLRDLEDSVNDVVSDLRELSDRSKYLANSITPGNYTLSPEMERVKNDLNTISTQSQRLANELAAKDRTFEEIRKRIENAVNSGDPNALDIEPIKELFSELLSVDRSSIGEITAAFSDLTSASAYIIEYDSVGLLEDIHGVTDTFSQITDNIGNSVDATMAALDPSIVDSRRRAAQNDLDKTIDSLYEVVDWLNAALNSSQDMSDPANDAVERVKSAWDFLDDGQANLVGAMYNAADATDKAASGTDILEEAFDIVHDVNTYFKEKSELVFTRAGDSITNIRDNIKTTAGKLLDSTSKLENVSGEGIEAISADLSKVNSRLDTISNIIIDIMEEIQSTSTDIKEYTEDISAEDSGGQSQGKVSSCKNYGTVDGDLNIGGINGTMGVDNELDPEGDLQLPKELTSSFIYKTKTVVRDCANYGRITSKRDCVGGITGNMETGCIFSSISAGTVESTDGSYAGGIAGKSSAAITGCSSDCRVSGASHIGGIAGEGHDITDCRSFNEFSDTCEYIGAVAGSADGKISGNIFVDNGIGGIDGISYKEQALPLPYEEFIREKGIASDFYKLTLVFAVTDDDGNITEEVKRYTTSYGGSISDENIPSVPVKDGCYGTWEEFNKEDIRFSQLICANYRKLLSTIGTAPDSSGRYCILAQGDFTEEDSITAEQQGSEWNVTLPGTRNYTIRYLRRYDNSYLIVNGERIQGTADGSYTVFDFTGDSFTLIEIEDSSIPIFVYIAAGAGGVVILLIIILITVKTHNKRKKKNN